MPIDILMPALSPTMESGTLAKWLVKVGDTVSAGDVIAEIETDKATMEVESIDEGKVGKIIVEEGSENVAVNALIAVLLEEGESEDAISDAPKASAAPTPQPATPADDTPSAPQPVTQSTTAAPPAPVSQASGGKIFASPLARRLAKDAGFDIAQISGTGPKGRVVKRDVEAALGGAPLKPAAPSAAAPQPSSAAPAPVVTPPSDEQIFKLFDEGSYELIAHDNMRKTIARRLVEAKSTIPHFYLTRDVTLDALLKLRADINGGAPSIDGNPAYKISVNDMIIKALALALQAVPDANVSWSDAGMLKHKTSDVGVAVSIPGGLITPVIRSAQTKPLSIISNEMKDMAGRARERKLKPEEYQGGSSAVSNLGMFGIKEFAAVINPPHATILAVGAGEKRAVVKDDAVAIAQQMSVTLSTDHRAVDGALGAQLLDAFTGFIEKPMSMLV